MSGISALSFQPRRRTRRLQLGLSLFLSFGPAHLIFKGERHLLAWQRQYSMGPLTGRAVSFYRKKTHEKRRKTLCSVLA